MIYTEVSVVVKPAVIKNTAVFLSKLLRRSVWRFIFIDDRIVDFCLKIAHSTKQTANTAYYMMQMTCLVLNITRYVDILCVGTCCTKFAVTIFL